MAVEKISFQKINPSENKRNSYQRALKPDIRESNDREKRNAAKEMKGSEALAIETSAGIIPQKKDEVSANGKTVEKEKIVSDSNFGDIRYIDTYDVKTNKKIKATRFYPDGKTVYGIYEYNPAGKLMKTTQFYSDGKATRFVIDYAPKTGNRVKITHFYKDGKTVKRIEDCNPQTGKRVKDTEFYTDGITPRCISEYNDKTGKKIKETDFNSDGKTRGSVCEFNLLTGEKERFTMFYPDGKTIEYIEEYDRSGNLVKAASFCKNGTIHSVYKHNTETGGIGNISLFNTD